MINRMIIKNISNISVVLKTIKHMENSCKTDINFLLLNIFFFKELKKKHMNLNLNIKNTLKEVLNRKLK